MLPSIEKSCFTYFKERSLWEKCAQRFKKLSCKISGKNDYGVNNLLLKKALD